jgi:ribonuclease HI
MIELPDVIIHTDGGTPTNPATWGAWGAVLRFKTATKCINGRFDEERTTNIRAEITAAIEALAALKKPCNVTLYSDLQLLVNGGNRTWKRGANHDLWQELDYLMFVHTVKFVWIKGHAGNPDNERCHRLVTEVLRRTA